MKLLSAHHPGPSKTVDSAKYSDSSKFGLQLDLTFCKLMSYSTGNATRMGDPMTTGFTPQLQVSVCRIVVDENHQADAVKN